MKFAQLFPNQHGDPAPHANQPKVQPEHQPEQLPQIETDHQPQIQTEQWSATVADYKAVREATEALTQPLADEDMVIQSMPDVSPTRWHLAHTAWFFETFLICQRWGAKRFKEQYDYLFNSYYNQVGEQFSRPRRGLLSRPTVREIFEYRQAVDNKVCAAIEQGLSDECAAILVLGLHHEQQHQELMCTDIKHVLAQNPLFPQAYEEPASAYPPAMSSTDTPNWVRIRAGEYEVGVSHTYPGFSFDCERPAQAFLQPDACVADRPVTNGEYAKFVADKGYQTAKYWHSDGWAFISEHGITHPLYWHADESGGWRQFTLYGLKPLESAEPVCHLSWYEANAYAAYVAERWSDPSVRLPTEQELELMLRSDSSTSTKLPQMHPTAVSGVSGSAGGGGANGNSINPVINPGINHIINPGEAQPTSQRATNLSSLNFGQVWEWSASAYLPYHGFRATAGAIGEYNGKFMSGQMVLKGGSCLTPPRHIRPSYRNFFPPSAQWQMTGFRLARDSDTA